MTARGKARKRAIDVLYQADLRGVPALDVLDTEMSDAAHPVRAFTIELVRGVVDNQARIDELLDAHSEGWPVSRMPAVDRAVLRLGTYELLWRDDVPDAVVIAEAVELAHSLSTDDSPGFVNGLLARLLQVKPHLTL